MNTPDFNRLIKWAGFAVVLLAVFLLFQSVSVIHALREPEAPANTISVSGTGKATSTPNIAEFSFGVSADADQVADAQNTVTAKTTKIVADLKKLGIADKDIQTSNYSVYPKYVYVSNCANGNVCPPNNQKQNGYTVNESVTVKVRDMGVSGQALAVAGEDGATNISGLSLTLDDPDAPTDLARERAIDDARARAEALAKELGVSLVRVTGYYDNASPSQPMPLYATGGLAKSAAPADIEAGENEVTVSVSVTYEIR